MLVCNDHPRVGLGAICYFVGMLGKVVNGYDLRAEKTGWEKLRLEMAAELCVMSG